MKNLIKLTITFPESETQTMILEKGSEAYNQMLAYAEINEGVTSEKPYLNSMNVEITKDAFDLLKGNDEKSWHDFKKTELAEFSYYKAHGVLLTAIHNFVSNVTQYYVKDINA